MSNNLTYHSVGSNDEACVGVTNSAGSYVGAYQNLFAGVATDAIKKLEYALTNLEENTNVVGTGADYKVAVSNGITYTSPTVLPAWAHTAPDVGLPSSNLPVIKSILGFSGDEPDSAPEKPTNIITDFPAIPPLNVNEPGDAPPVEDINIPVPPTMDDIEDPILYPINIPDSIDPVDIPLFSGILPSLDITAPSIDFTWSEDDYDSAILTATQSRIAEFLEGGVGIPDYVWDRIWYRGKDKADKIGNKLVKEITEEWSSRGFTLPQGQELSQASEARIEAARQTNELNRELVIQQSKHEIENLKFAVAQGQSLEAMIGGWYQQRMTRALDAAKFMYQAEIEIYNAQIKLFTAQISLFNAQIAEYKVALEASLTVLEQQKIYLEGQKIIADINRVEVSIYEANINAYRAEIEAYNGYIKGLMAEAENNAIKMQAYKIEVEAYGELVKAKNLEYVGRESEIKTEQLKLDIFETEVTAYGKEVDAYGTNVDASFKSGQLEQINNDNAFKSFNSTIESHNLKLKNRIDGIIAASTQYDAAAKNYQLKVENAKSVSDIKLKSEELSLKEASDETNANIETAKNMTAAAMKEAELVKSTSDMLTKAYAQVAASAMSVIHVSAGLTDSSSNSAGCSTTYSGGNV